MGLCKDCLHFDRSYEQKRVFQKTLYGCTYQNIYVTEDGSCSAFTPRPTYNKGGSDCFLTSACVDYLDKADDCYELTTIRNFRDTYMKSVPDGMNLIKEYYEKAPSIVDKINSSGRKDEYYSYIYGVVKECVSDIERGDNHTAMTRYIEMTRKLENELLGGIL